MGSSLILQGGAAVAKTLKESVTQAGHGFTVGDVIRWDGAQVPPKYVKAIADTAQNAEVAGVVSGTPDSNEFEVTYHGYIDLPSLSGISAPVMFLSGSVGGSLAASPPSAVGTVVKPVLTKNSNGSGYLVMNYLGTQIGGSSTIAVDEIQPVGTIMPYAGTAIPDTWLACDGGSYAMSAYPELYEKICFTTGERAPMYGHIVEICPNSQVISSTEWTASAVGDYIYIKNRTTTASASVPDVNTEASYDFVGRIIAKGSVTHTTADGWTVRILGKYNTTSKRFEMPNAFVLSVSGGFSSSIRVYSGVATGARGSGGGVNTASAVAFNTPNLRGRFLFGEVGSGEFIPDADPETLSTFAYDYPMASWGGEERHAITTAEIPAHTHTASTSSDGAHTHNIRTSHFDPISHGHNNDTARGAYDSGLNQAQGPGDAGGTRKTATIETAGAHSHTVTVANTGSNTPHNNMPPYMAVRYIIKAKPYTRAAIIDGIDLPYNSLLVRDLRTRNVGGSNGDLVFLTNTSGDSGNGTERVRVLGSGGTVVVGVTSSASNTLSANSAGLYITNSTKNSLADLYVENSDANLSTGGGITLASFVCSTLGSTQRRPRLHIKATDEGIILNESYNVDATNLMFAIGNVEKMRLNATGLGVLTNSPGATLDVNGTLKVGDFGGSTNVLAKLNNSVPTANTPSVGCVVPLHAITGANNTIPLPAGTWFVYLTGTENATTADEDTQVVMAKVWTVASSNFLRFKPTAALTTTNTGISYSDSTSSAVDGSGTFTAIPLTDSYAAGSAAFSTVFAAGTHKGLAHSVSNSGIDLISGFAIRIA